MLGEEKKGLNLLLHFRICNIYAKTHASTSLISEMTGMPLSSVKRSIKILDNEYERCVELLPTAQEEALSMGLVTQLDLIDEEQIQEIRRGVFLARIEKTKINNWQDISLTIDSDMDRYIEDTKSLQEYNSKRLYTPAKKTEEYSALLVKGYSFRDVAETYGISTSVVAYNTGKKGSTK